MMRVVAPRSRCADDGFKPPCAALVEDRRGERSRKRASVGGCQVGAGKTNASEPLWKRRNAWMASELGFEGALG